MPPLKTNHLIQNFINDKYKCTGNYTFVLLLFLIVLRFTRMCVERLLFVVDSLNEIRSSMVPKKKNQNRSNSSVLIFCRSFFCSQRTYWKRLCITQNHLIVDFILPAYLLTFRWNFLLFHFSAVAPVMSSLFSFWLIKSISKYSDATYTRLN